VVPETLKRKQKKSEMKDEEGKCKLKKNHTHTSIYFSQSERHMQEWK
jgi:hypothetical protein